MIKVNVIGGTISNEEKEAYVQRAKKLYPEKNTVLALALVTAMKQADVNNLFNVMGYSFDKERVRDVVCEYLLTNGVFNEEMRDACLAEYKITNLPIKRKESGSGAQA